MCSAIFVHVQNPTYNSGGELTNSMDIPEREKKTSLLGN